MGNIQRNEAFHLPLIVISHMYFKNINFDLFDLVLQNYVAEVINEIKLQNNETKTRLKLKYNKIQPTSSPAYTHTHIYTVHTHTFILYNH